MKVTNQMTKGKTVAFFTNYKELTALEQLRVVSPIMHSNFNLEINDGKSSRDDVDLVNHADFVLFQRNFAENYPRYQLIINRAKELNIPIIFDLDDLLFQIPKTHIDRQTSSFGPSILAMAQALKDADLVTVSTENLKRQLEGIVESICVLPNYLDDTFWRFQQAQKSAADSGLVKIIYMGSVSHQSDLDLIEDVLAQILVDYPNNLSIRFIGLPPPTTIRSQQNVSWEDVKFFNYVAFAHYFQTVEADIALLPLADNLFNTCKSEIKFLECSSSGAACIASNVDPYKNIIENGYNGFLAASPDEWYKKITTLINEPETRFTFSLNAQKLIENDWLIRNQAHNWENAYSKAHSRSTTALIDFPRSFFENLVLQTYEYSLINKNEEKRLVMRINELDERIKDLEYQASYRSIPSRLINRVKTAFWRK